MKEKRDVVEIDLKQLLQVLCKKLWIIALSVLLFGGAAFAFTHYFVTPLYQSSVKLYVNNSSITLGSTEFSISSSELTAAQSLVDTYIVILNTRLTLTEVIKEAGLNCSVDELEDMMSASAVNGTEIFEVVVTSDKPRESEKIANTIARVLPEKIAGIVDGSSVRVVDYAVVATKFSSPHYSLNAVVGALLGLVLSTAVIIIRDVFDDAVRSEEYLMQSYDIPVLAVIPDINAKKSNTTYDIYADKPTNGVGARRKGV